MATRAANKRLTREYKTIQENPPPYIRAKPSDSNILEWHYIIEGPENTPYHGGQYWGVLMFPPTYPFAPPSIKMHTPSGRFQPSTRLCLSISDFHPKSFNPAWEVSTILIGLLSFMTSEEMTTGSVSGTDAERQFLAARSRWWNSTGGGSCSPAKSSAAGGRNNVKAGDGGRKFREEWPEVHEGNLALLAAKKVDLETGVAAATGAGPQDEKAKERSCAPRGLTRPAASARPVGLDGTGGNWVMRNKLLLFGGLVVAYVLLTRMLGGAMAAGGR